ncbi:MAG: GNAT family N-acetyltransferase [Anaerolineae bacterium]|nr:GNAT family N-acetyltransferase [Anaerolineae bacterium]
MADPNVVRDLGDGLVLRRATPDDLESLLALQGETLRDPDETEPNEHLIHWTRDLMSGTHPTIQPSDFTLVVDTKTGAAVSSLNLISQTWAYAGIPFGVGRPEVVCTLPDYRGRGLVRAQFEVIHGWSAERGELVQAITGIPWFYRQFGYEMAMDLGGDRKGYRTHVPKLKDGEPEPYRVRPAQAVDLPFIAQLYAHGQQRYPITCLRDDAMWRYELDGRHPKNGERTELRIVETAGGEPVGFLTHLPMVWKGKCYLWKAFELKPGISWAAVIPGVFRYLQETGDAYAAATPKHGPCETFVFSLGADHPAYHAARNLLPDVRKPYAWYMRVADLPGFLRHVRPALETRLAASILSGHTGEAKISFYRSGLRLVLEGGRLTEITPWQPTVKEGGDAAFPNMTFLQMLFGYRTFDELDAAFADCWAGNDTTRELLDALFPKSTSCVWPIS